MARLRDGQLGDPRVHDISNYIKRGKLWEAFTSPELPVLLIDEIDKADIEFPNDLLQELDRMEFHVYETGETVKAVERPVVVITSNNEKELPDAFLRRCFFHYIRFPDRATMEAIVDVHFPGIQKMLVGRALDIFYDIREVPGLKKKPSTSELLDWLKLLLHEDMPLEVLQNRDPTKAIPPLHGALAQERAGRDAVRAAGVHGAAAGLKRWRAARTSLPPRATRIIRPAQSASTEFQSLTVPTFRGSTVLFADLDALDHPRDGQYRYGVYGTPTARELELRLAAIEGAESVALAPSGLAAISLAMLALLRPGDHLLLTASAYGPTRELAEGLLAELGVETTLYEPTIGAGIAELIRDETRLVWCESPGSITMEVQDVPAIAAAAHARGVLVAIDNSYGAGLLFDAFAAGADSVDPGAEQISGRAQRPADGVGRDPRSRRWASGSGALTTRSAWRSRPTNARWCCAASRRSTFGCAVLASRRWRWPAGWPSGRK